MKITQKTNFNYINNNFASNKINNKNVAANNFCLHTSPNAYYNCGEISFCKKKLNDITADKNYDKYLGCILGGAIGDAFGAPVEFMKRNKIHRYFGSPGVTKLYHDKRTREYKFTDDTQLTMFTIYGLLKSTKRKYESPQYNIMFDAYRDWYKMCAEGKRIKKGWITDLDKMRGTDGSGKTCMSVLSQDKFGTTKDPINLSKSSGAIMRTAPIGLYYKNPKKAFEVAVNTAALTHGHPSAYYSAGAYAVIISEILNGHTIPEAVEECITLLRKENNTKEVIDELVLAQNLASTDEVMPLKAINQLGKGWDGHEALGIAVYCALKTPNDLKMALINSVNHDGDSDTVGSITGGIIGTSIGYENIPDEFKNKIMLEKELKTLAQDLFLGPDKIHGYNKRY
ncbi:ADP-ribosylglycohydrolase family protein [bacterium]|nr:ADP-ribosylglycohydrolase family protein [bacterium]